MTLEQGILDQPRQWIRQWRRSLGLASSVDVARLSNMLVLLKDMTEAKLRTPVEGIVLSFPGLAALYDEDIEDAITYSKLIRLQSHISQGQVRELQGAFGGYGHGICKSYLESKACFDEIMDTLPWHNVLLVHYSKELLSAQSAILISVDRRSNERPQELSVDFGAGSRNQRTPEYWQRVDTVLQKAARNRQSWNPKVDLVLFSGESAEDEEFRGKVRIILAEYGEVVYDVGDETHVAAKGAAKLAWLALNIQRHGKNSSRSTHVDDHQAPLLLNGVVGDSQF